ncbi:helix-turn-helix domain-containing protein [Metabacillus sp. HB246100]
MKRGVSGKYRRNKKITFKENARLIGTLREAITRMLDQLKKDRIIHYTSGYLTITDLEGLRKIYHCADCPLQVCRL